MDDSTWNTRLRLVKVALAAIVVGLFLVQRDPSTWPIVNWTMYSSKTDLFPEETWWQGRLRVFDDATGEAFDLWPWDLIDRELYWMIDVTMYGASQHPDPDWRRDSREYLHRMIRHARPELKDYRVEVWKLEWNVDPLAVPPFDRDRPDNVTLMGGFDSRGER